MPYLLLFLLLIASPSLAQVGPVINTDCVISWDPNTETDLWGYLLSVRKDSEPYNTAATWTLTPTTSSTCSSLGTLPNGQYYAAVSAYDIYGYESLKSDEAPFYLEKVTVIISIAKSGTGSGTVRSSQAGINCGTVCSYEFPPSTSVKLMATAASGSVFAGWIGGGCSGTGNCTVKATSLVTAIFNKKTK